MLKILYVIDSLGLGGTERQLCLLLKYPHPEWETRVVSLDDGPFSDMLRKQGNWLNIFQRKFKYDLVPAINLWRIIWEYKPLIIHSWGGLSSTFVAPLCKIAGIKLIASIRSAGIPRKNLWRTRIINLLADKVIANSQAGLLAYKIPAFKGKVIYNAIDPARFESPKLSRKTHHDRTTVVMAARMVPEKDFFTLIDAARKISNVHQSSWSFIALGSGKLRKTLIKYADDLISLGIMEFPEVGTEIIPYLNESDIGVLLTNTKLHQEGFSNSITEYMACGLPVICSDSGGNREIVKHHETGFVITPGSIDALVERLLFLKNNPVLAKKMGQMGKRRVNAMCSVERIVNEYMAEYKVVLLPRN